MLFDCPNCGKELETEVSVYMDCGDPCCDDGITCDGCNKFIGFSVEITPYAEDEEEDEDDQEEDEK